jgi:hypothetical protein
VIVSYRFPRSGVVCDLPGEQGILLAEILHARPELHGMIVEAPNELTRAAEYLTAAGVAHRVELRHGDRLGSVTAIADLYLLNAHQPRRAQGFSHRNTATGLHLIEAGRSYAVDDGRQPPGGRIRWARAARSIATERLSGSVRSVWSSAASSATFREIFLASWSPFRPTWTTPSIDHRVPV